MSGGHAQRFGPYVILDRIGDGGMAEIFLAKMQGYSGFEKLIALKKIHPRYSRNETFAQMLIHEAKLAAALTHFNVVQVHDLGEIDDQVYIAMEYVRGRDLAAVLSNTYRRGEQLPLELALFVATEFMTGLEYAHRMRASDGMLLGIIHRDISPQNILISYEGEVKVTDFGIARIISEKNGFQLPGNLHGKFGYMSPEQALNREIDQRSDVFSAGVVLWEMLVGARLFRGRDQQDTVQLVSSKEIPAPSSLNPDVPASVDRICLKALARDRNQRYQTMGALLGELSRAAESLPRRAGSRDLSVYMRRQFGTSGGGFRKGRGSGPERSSASQHSGFDPPGVVTAELEPVTPSQRVPLGQILLQKGAINLGELELALAEQRAQGGRIGEILVGIAALDDEALAEALATQASLPVMSTADLEALPPPSDLLARYPRHAAESLCILPVAVDASERSVRLAVCDPYDDRGVLEAKVVLGVNEVALIVAPRSAIRRTLTTWYPSHADTPSPSPSAAPLFGETASVEAEPAVGRVLVADADHELAESLAARVRLEGWEVDVVHDGRSARAACRERPPTVAFLDAALPGIDGYNLLLELRAQQTDAAVFIVSARSDEFRQSKALELGADDFLAKPLALEVVASKIRREMAKRTQGRGRNSPPPVRFSGVSGSLTDMTVIDIAQSLELGRKTAHVVVQYEDGRQGILRVDAGELRAAAMPDAVGPDAFYRLARPGPGLFRIEYRASTLERNIDHPNTFLLVEAMRHVDEGTADGPPEAPRWPAWPEPEDGPTAGRFPSLESAEATADGDLPSFGLADDLTLEPASGTGERTARHDPEWALHGDGAERAARLPELPMGGARGSEVDAGSGSAALLEQWVVDQLESPPAEDAPSSGKGATIASGTEVARIPLQRVRKPD